MIIAYSILLYQFLFIRADAGPPDPPGTSPTDKSMYSHSNEQSVNPLLPPNHLKLKIISNKDMTWHVNLKQTKRVLANNHLPVWILNGIVNRDTLKIENDHRLKRNHKVMEQLGGFTVYQEAETSAAAIYFHKRHEFDGVIGYEFLIEKLSIDRIHPTDETSLPLKRYGVYRRRKYMEHKYDCKKKAEEDPRSGVNYQGHMKTYEGRVYNGYPEVLVIVSWDVAEVWAKGAKETDRYTTIVSNVLTLFNGVDMLYSKLQNTNIQINIAGIIVGMEEESFEFLDECYCSEDGHSQYKLDGRCVNSFLLYYLYVERQKIPTESYDIVIFLTREHITSNNNGNCANKMGETFIPVNGLASCIDRIYECRKNYEAIILVGSVMITEYLENYPVVAHEMAHLMTVMHDKSQFFTHDGNCCGHIMKTNGGWCKKCLTWSETSEESFNLFFSSPNCCAFLNKPRSLYPTGPLQMLTADEQCQCYGYESAKEYGQVLNSFCHAKLQCKGEDNEFHDTVAPMDGTSCDNNKVCWKKNCEKVEIYEHSNHEN